MWHKNKHRGITVFNGIYFCNILRSYKHIFRCRLNADYVFFCFVRGDFVDLFHIFPCLLNMCKWVWYIYVYFLRFKIQVNSQIGLFMWNYSSDKNSSVNCIGNWGYFLVLLRIDIALKINKIGVFLCVERWSVSGMINLPDLKNITVRWSYYAKKKTNIYIYSPHRCLPLWITAYFGIVLATANRMLCSARVVWIKVRMWSLS